MRARVKVREEREKYKGNKEKQPEAWTNTKRALCEGGNKKERKQCKELNWKLEFLMKACVNAITVCNLLRFGVRAMLNKQKKANNNSNNNENDT